LRIVWYNLEDRITVGKTAAQLLRKGGVPVERNELYDTLRWISMLLTLVFSVRKIFRWLRRKFRNGKTHRPKVEGLTVGFSQKSAPWVPTMRSGDVMFPHGIAPLIYPNYNNPIHLFKDDFRFIFFFEIRLSSGSGHWPHPSIPRLARLPSLHVPLGCLSAFMVR